MDIWEVLRPKRAMILTLKFNMLFKIFSLYFCTIGETFLKFINHLPKYFVIYNDWNTDFVTWVELWWFYQQTLSITHINIYSHTTTPAIQLSSIARVSQHSYLYQKKFFVVRYFHSWLQLDGKFVLLTPWLKIFT